MGRSAKDRMSEFARASKERLSGRRLISPKPERKKAKTAMVIEMVDQRRSQTTSDEVDVGPANTSFTSSQVPADASANSCVLMVGSTGTGKSATIAKLTGQEVKHGDSLRGVTKRCDIYRPAKNNRSIFPDSQHLFFVDTVGFEDPDVDDAETFKDILRFIDNNNIANLRAVIWTVMPNVRQDALLNRQAALIDKFGEREVWNRVIISCKQSTNVEADTRGAFAAALDFNPRATVQRLGHRFLDDSSLTMDQQITCENDSGSRKTWGVKTDDEIRLSFLQAFDEIGSDEGDFLKVVFNEKRCADCGVIGDPRLLPKFCHMKMHKVHKIRDPEPVHPLELTSYHPEEIPFKTHPGYLVRSPWYRDIRRKRVYTCCSGKLTSSGCCLKWKCCSQQHKISTDAFTTSAPPSGGCRKKYTCCSEGAESRGCENLFPCCGRNRNQDGCLEVCLKCEKPWGTESDKCFVKTHNVRDLSDFEPEPKIGPVKTPRADTLTKIENGILPTRKSLLERCELPKTIPLMII